MKESYLVIKLNTRIIVDIVDRKDVVFMLLDDDKVHPTYDTGIWVNTPFFASTLGDMFEQSWKSMKAAE